MKPVTPARTLCAAVLLLVSACGVQSTKPSRLFVLAPVTDAADAMAATTTGPAVLVGPVTLPAYTDRTAILVRARDEELVPQGAARWAEPLDRNFTRVLVENLSTLLGSERIAALGGMVAQPHHQVVVDVTEFVTGDDGQAALTAYWQILGDDGRTVLSSHKSRFKEPVAGKQDIAAAVAAQGRTVAALSREIAQALSAAR